MARISIIGSGFVGRAVGEGFIRLGNRVIFHDIDENKIRELICNGFLIAKTLKEAVKKTDISFVCVPTPTIRKKIDLTHIISVSEGIGSILSRKKGYHIVVIKSTVLPGTTEKIIIPILEEKSKKKVRDGFGVCVNPEFLTQISRSWTENHSFTRDFFNEDRVVIGENDRISGDVVEELYRPLNVPIFRTDLRTAEMIKYTSNCALASKISFWNEIFQICQNLDIDSQKVADIVSMDERIGVYGTKHGKAFGGACLPKDLKALITFVKENYGFDPVLLKAVDSINDYMVDKYGVRE